MYVFLETERLVLRDFDATDADNLLGLDADAEVMRYLTGGKPTPRAAIEGVVLPAFMAPRGRLKRWVWAAIEKQTGGFAGWFSLRPPDGTSSDNAELGFRLRKEFWNRGYATEGATALVTQGFARIALQRIWAETMFVNLASRRVLEKAGLRHVRTFHLQWDDPIEGSEHGEVEYALTREEWIGDLNLLPDQTQYGRQQEGS